MKTYLPVYGLVTALLLAACGQPTQPPSGGSTNPVQSSTLGSLYEVDFQGVGKDKPSVTTQSLTDGLHGQALVNVAGTQLTLGSDPLFISSFIDRATNIRHIQATFKVTNNGSTPLDNLVFLPTVTADTDNDPSNNAAAPTIAGTPFQTVEFFDGSDASSRATSLALGHGQLLNTTSGAVTDDPDASPFLTGLDVSGVVPVPPTGLSASVATVGWQVSPSLAPGQSANVTFAVDEQNADANNPKNDPYRFSLLVAAAQSDAASAAGTINPGVIRGTVSDSALFGGKVVLVNGVSFPNTQFNAAATVSFAGSIDLPLGVPPTSDFTAALPPQGDPCTYSGTVSDSSARIAGYAGLLASSSQGDPVATIQEAVVSGAKVPGAIVSRVYVNAPLVLKAKVSCSNRPYTIDYDVTLQQGWNAVEVSGNNSASVMKNLSPDARSALKVTRRTPGVTVSLDDSSVINLKPGEHVTRNAYFSQVGAYSGTVNLSTNIPGVSVEPSTVTLGSLGTQSIRPEGWTPALNGDIKAQSLSTPITFVAAANAPTHYAYSYNDALIIKDGSGTQVGSGNINVSLIIPGVYAYVNNNNVSLAQGGTTTLSVNLSSVNGLNGPVTVSLSGLPSGVTVTPQTVQVTPSSGGTANIQLSATADAVTGTSTVSLLIDRPNSNTSTYSTQATLNVVPARTLLSTQSVADVLPARAGTWIKSNPIYLGNNQNSLTLTRIQNGQTIKSIDFAYSASDNTPLLLPTPSGNIILSTYSLIELLHDDGGPQDSYLTGGTGWSASTIAADYRDRVWALKTNTYTEVPLVSLTRYDPNTTTLNPAINAPTGELVTIDDSGMIAQNSTLRVSNDGRTMVITSSTPGKTFAINTETATITNLNMTLNDPSNVVVGNDGTVWISSYGTIQRRNPDGSLTAISGLQGSTLIGIDRQDPDILWLNNSNKIVRFSISGQSVKTLDFSTFNVFKAVLPFSGGLDVASGSYNAFYLSHLN
ncbi:hypothetical protein MF271_02275 (plasmid) [Deinococcus sp. KNUC1210]|uniref:hypothetical protein n=1 Tax=Deinococcus sp. KNUC1210 TaxID=2917691 RepID=UPI001EF070A4|nr:hypothetical protein [Deinococcus sp. KNUC1210]ULH14127.1 hypothetical protein MF271_02275 [Deinococcus sp. KNUC1210]